MSNGFKKGHKGFRIKESYPRGKNHFWFGKKHTEKAKIKMRKPHKPMSEATKQLLKKLNTGKHLSEETKQKQREAHSGEKNYLFGKHLSDITKQKLREFNLGNKNALGHKLTEATKEIIRQASLKQFKNGMPKKTKIKISLKNIGKVSAMKGKKHLSTTLKRMSLAQTNR